MSITALQEHIRKKKTPLALGLGPEANRLPAPVVKRFTDLYGESVMARSEALRYHGTQLMAQAAQRLPAVVLRADRYLLCGAMGLDVLSNLVHMARSQGLYAIVDARCADPAVWLGGEVNADAVTISPYYGTAAAGEDKALFALVRTAEPGAAEVQNLMAGDRRRTAPLRPCRRRSGPPATGCSARSSSGTTNPAGNSRRCSDSCWAKGSCPAAG